MSVLINLNLKSSKKLIFLLTTVFGLGRTSSKKICEGLGYDENIRMVDLASEDVNKLSTLINVKYKYIVDTDLKKNLHDNIQLKKNIKAYKGIRHSYHLPVNGQRTHTNAKTIRR